MSDSNEILRAIAMMIESETFESVQIDPNLLREIANEFDEMQNIIENQKATIAFLEQVAEF